jgi:hypothetical protein
MAAVTDIRVQTNWRHHPKRKKLQKRLGADGVLALMDLWLWIGDTRPTGDLSGMDAEDIAIAADWTGDAAAFVFALVELGLLDQLEGGGFVVHDWEAHNPWAFGAERRSEAASAAGKRSGEIRREKSAKLLGSNGRSTGRSIPFNVERENSVPRSTPVPVPPPVPSPSPVRTSRGSAPVVDEVLPDNSEDARARSQQPAIARAIADRVPPDQPPEPGALAIVNDAWYRWQRKDLLGKARVAVDEWLAQRVPPEHIAACVDAIARADRDGRIRQSPLGALAKLVEETPVGSAVDFQGDMTRAARTGDLGLAGLRQVKDALGRKDAEAAAGSGVDPPKTGRVLIPADGQNRSSSTRWNR